MEYIKLWAENIINETSINFNKEITIKEEYKKHYGPGLHYAMLEVKIEPAKSFDVEFAEKTKDLSKDTKIWLDSAILGILDEILVKKPFPLKDIKITLLDVKTHPVDSNKLAFRYAGRNIGKKILSQCS